MKTICSIALLALTSCSLLDDEICFVSQSGFSQTLIKKDFSAYERSLISEIDERISGTGLVCSDVDTICIDGPFYVKIQREKYNSLVGKNRAFSIDSIKDKTLYRVSYSKKFGVSEFSIISNFDGEIGAPAMTFAKCNMEFGRLFLPS